MEIDASCGARSARVAARPAAAEVARAEAVEAPGAGKADLCRQADMRTNRRPEMAGRPGVTMSPPWSHGGRAGRAEAVVRLKWRLVARTWPANGPDECRPV